ncbi:hypothetical protein [Streptomyces sp. NPDC056663]
MNAQQAVDASSPYRVLVLGAGYAGAAAAIQLAARAKATRTCG